MDLTVDAIAWMAPDHAALEAAQRLAPAAVWSDVGRSSNALWGRCLGGALYDVQVDLRDLAAKCSCPSRKNPCKHGLALMLRAATRELPEGAPPPSVAQWIDGRGLESAKREAALRAPDPEAQARRAERREARVLAGIVELERFLDDVVRGGLAQLELDGLTLLDAQAARLVDAQAPGLARRLRRVATMVHGSVDWPERVLDELGQVALLARAFAHEDDLPPPLRAEVRAQVGFTLDRVDVLAAGDLVRDRWLVLGDFTDEDERLSTRRTWLRGAAGGRSALVLQFSVGGAPFAERLAPGTAVEATLAFWPGALPLRALVRERHGPTQSYGAETFPGATDVGGLLDEAAAAGERWPLWDRLPCALAAALPVASGERWRVVDGAGRALPLRGAAEGLWRLVALSGGAPIAVAGEWDGEALLPLGAIADGAYHALGASLEAAS